MKFILLFLTLTLSIQLLHGQDSLVKVITQQTDIILRNIDKEKDPVARFKQIVGFYLLGVESQPFLVLETAQKLYKISQKNHDAISEACAWSLYGQGYRLSGNYTKGLECHYKALALSEKIDNSSVLALVQNQLAHIYKDRDENQKALKIYKASLENAQKGKNDIIQIYPLMNIGNIYLKLNQTDSSLYYSQLSYRMNIKRNIKTNTPYLMLNIAGAYSKMQQKEKAEQYYYQSVDWGLTLNSLRILQMTYVGLSDHYKRYQQLDSSIFYAKKSIAVVQNTVFAFLSLKPSLMLSDIYETINADSAVKYMRIYKAANDSMYSTRINQQLQMLTFDEEQRQQEINMARIDYRNKIRTNLLIGGIAVLALIMAILYRSNKQKLKANKQLKNQKEKIEVTLNQLKSTQSQLIHSEKMASLGELTAGIAHEIQNPLNFVNNFSEVNRELLNELKDELKKGNLADVKQIADDVIANEQKINHHGKRADAIVKGMLQHSRSSNGVKEPTDINALADEYLRLAYHGLRAKDKEFNATLVTDFDDKIGMVNMIPQDMGRVILNLITNAFYAVAEKKKQSNDGYEPSVTVTTKRIVPLPGGPQGVEVRVADNGNGIPQKALDKIFQPFFTTKPTGQGTGLGLSLSYDIVKVHGGELKVETKDGEGTTFIILLPA